jgi:hypothetical protein
MQTLSAMTIACKKGITVYVQSISLALSYGTNPLRPGPAARAQGVPEAPPASASSPEQTLTG